MNKKMKALDKASKVNFKFENMDSETQEAIKSLINHLMVKREEKKLKKNETRTRGVFSRCASGWYNRT